MLGRTKMLAMVCRRTFFDTANYHEIFPHNGQTTPLKFIDRGDCRTYNAEYNFRILTDRFG